MTDTRPEQAAICVACVGNRTNPDGGPCCAAKAQASIRTRWRRLGSGWRHEPGPV
jgi:hypothetical protein